MTAGGIILGIGKIFLLNFFFVPYSKLLHLIHLLLVNVLALLFLTGLFGQ